MGRSQRKERFSAGAKIGDLAYSPANARVCLPGVFRKGPSHRNWNSACFGATMNRLTMNRLPLSGREFTSEQIRFRGQSEPTLELAFFDASLENLTAKWWECETLPLEKH